jgi:hypothetical protein
MPPNGLQAERFPSQARCSRPTSKRARPYTSSVVDRRRCEFPHFFDDGPRRSGWALHCRAVDRDRRVLRSREQATWQPSGQRSQTRLGAGVLRCAFSSSNASAVGRRPVLPVLVLLGAVGRGRLCCRRRPPLSGFRSHRSTTVHAHLRVGAVHDSDRWLRVPGRTYEQALG